MQDNHPICFLSRALGPQHQALSVYEKELLVVVHAVQIWNSYLSQGPFIIKTDQRSLKYLLDQKVTTPFQHLWLSKLLGFSFEIQYKKGKENVVADALSRVPSSQILSITLSRAHDGFYDSIKLLWQQDASLRQIVSDLKANPASHPKFTFTNDELRRKEKLVIGNDNAIKLHIFKWLNDSPIGGHSGRDATLTRIKSLFYWPVWTPRCEIMYETVKSVREISMICRRDLAFCSPPIPTGVWQSISLDFIEGLPPSYRKHCILVLIDLLSKYADFIALSHPYTALDVAQLFLDNVFKLHGFPKSVISDRDSTFLSEVWQELFCVFGVDLNFSTAYHPQTDGQTEVTNKTLETYLLCMTSDTPTPGANCFLLRSSGTTPTFTLQLNAHRLKFYMDSPLPCTCHTNQGNHHASPLIAVCQRGKK